MRASANGDVPEFNITDHDFAAKAPAVHDAREQCWYARSNVGLIALRYDEVRKILRDKRLRQGVYAWPEQNGVTEGLFAEWLPDNPLCKVGEDHRRIRRLINPIFAPDLIEGMASGFADLGNELIDKFADRGECEFMHEFATPFSSRVLLRLIGLPEDNWERVAQLATDMADSFGVEIARELPKIEAALAELYGIADEAIARSRENPDDGFVSRLVTARDGDDRLSEQEMRALLVTFLFAGMDTTKNQLGLAMLMFTKHPDQWELLRKRPELAATAVEESMRTDPTVLWITREAVEDLEMDGVSIPAGTTVHLFTESANTDPRVGGDAPFAITATERPKQLTFGAGPHHCVGHLLTRIDMREALKVLAQRLSNLRLAAEPKLGPESASTNMPLELKLAFDLAPPA